MIKERAVFPLDFLKAVANTRKRRSREPKSAGVNRQARVYPLSKLVYCAHCEQMAEEQGDPRLRTRLVGGFDPRKKRRYKHKPGVSCGVTNRSVKSEHVEAEIGRLLRLLTLKEVALDYMTELAIQSENGWEPSESEEDLAREKQEMIALYFRLVLRLMSLMCFVSELAGQIEGVE
jgi:hypothetical protein